MEGCYNGFAVKCFLEFGIWIPMDPAFCDFKILICLISNLDLKIWIQLHSIFETNSVSWQKSMEPGLDLSNCKIMDWDPFSDKSWDMDRDPFKNSLDLKNFGNCQNKHST